MSRTPVLCLIAFFAGGLFALGVSSCSRRFGWVETPEPPLAKDHAGGPFRPRPKPPEPPPAPEPEPTDERDRVLFGRVRQWAENAAERRAATTVQSMIPTDAEIDAAVYDELNDRPPRTMGSPGAWLAVTLTKLATRVIKAVLGALLLAALVALAWANWHWLAAAGGVIVAASAVLSRGLAWLFGRKE